MDLQKVQNVFRQLGYPKTRILSTGWVKGSCPFARWTHEGSTDSNPSFGIKVNISGESRYSCFTCHRTGGLTFLVNDLDRTAKRAGSGALPYDALRAFVINNEKVDPPSEIYANLSTKKGFNAANNDIGLIGLKDHAPDTSEDVEPDPLPESALDVFTKPTGLSLEYLTEKRHLSPEAISTFELGWHEKAGRISIPIRDFQNRLMGISGRAVSPTKVPKFLHSKGFRRDFLLYGENVCDKGGTGILVEGFFDVHRLRMLGYRRTVAMMGTYLSRFQQEKLVRFFNRIIVLLDGDRAGIEAALRVQKQLSERIPVSVVALDEGKDPDDLTAADALPLIGPP